MLPKQEENETQIALNFPHTIIHPLQFPLRKHELAHALKNSAPQAPFSNIGVSQMVAIEQLYEIFSKVADNVKKRAYPPQQQTVKKIAIVTQKVCPDKTKPFPTV